MFLRFQKVNGLNIQAEYKSSKQADSYSLLISVYHAFSRLESARVNINSVPAPSVLITLIFCLCA